VLLDLGSWYVSFTLWVYGAPHALPHYRTCPIPYRRISSHVPHPTSGIDDRDRTEMEM
jgi:hypothetical protein